MPRLALLLGLVLTLPAQAAFHALVVSGLGGQERYQQSFDKQGKRAMELLQRHRDGADVRLLNGRRANRQVLLSTLSAFAARTTGDDVFVLFLLGHGSFDGDEYKFNLHGPDLSASDLAEALQPIGARRQLIIVASSASGAVLPALDDGRRTVISATRNGQEINASHFYRFFVEALGSHDADLNKDLKVSAREGFDLARHRVTEHYQGQKLLLTEHAHWQGPDANVTLTWLAAPRAGLADSPAALRRSILNAEIDSLRQRKDSMPLDDYLQALEPLLEELARIELELERTLP